MRALLAAVVLAVLVATGSARADELDAIREDLDAARFEKALQEIDLLLARPDLSDATKVEALGLRASAHVASGDLDRAEADWRQILPLDPAWSPDRSLTPKKALARFDKARAAMVGQAPLDLRPPDARLTVDGKEVRPQADGTLMLLAGERTIHAERKGFDPADVKIQVAPGAAAPVKIALVPNSRTVVLRTEPDGVAVGLDDRSLGLTARRAGGAAGAPAEIAIDEVSIGEHFFELSKACYRTVRVRVLVTVDLMDPSPLLLEPVTLAVSRSRIVLDGGVAGADVLVDGARVGNLPLESLDVCSGERSIEVVSAGRVLWRQRLAILEGEETRIAIAPRPNAVLLGTETWPVTLAALSEAVSSVPGPKVPAGADLSSKEVWDRIDFPPGVDLAVGVAPASTQGGDDRVYLYSPVLKRLYPVASELAVPDRPAFRRTTIGARLVDSEAGGSARVVEALPGGPAAAAGIGKGDRIVKIAGADVKDARQAAVAIEAQAAGAAIPVEVASAAGASRAVTVTAAASPWLRSGKASDPSTPMLAAWASVTAAASPDDAQAALASLGMLLSSAGQHQRAVEVLRRVRLGDRAGVGDGTVSYLLGRELAMLGQEKEAREAFERAARTAATAITDDGPEIKGAAADHLVDLGLAR